MPRLPLYFARRYLFSKKSHSIINIISGVSAFAVAIPVAAMVILLSVFNGFEGLTKQMYKSFDPDLLITPARGKVFGIDSVQRARLMQVDGVQEASYSLEENVLFTYRGRQAVGIMRGVDSLYERVVPLDGIVRQGQYRLRFGEFREAVVGQGMAYKLGLYSPALSSAIEIYAPRRGRISPLLLQSFYKKESIFPSGIFELEAQTDEQYVIVDLGFAQRILDHEGRASAVSVRLTDGADAQQVQAGLQRLLGDGFKIQTRFQQKESFYRIMTYEKWGIYFIILLVLVIASFSLVGSLVMLIIDKRKDMRTLITMGAGLKLVRTIFVTEGMLIYLSGALLGMLLGLGLSLLQQHFGLLKISGDTFLLPAYPVEVHAADLLWVVVTFVALSYLISRLTVRAMIPKGEIRLN